MLLANALCRAWEEGRYLAQLCEHVTSIYAKGPALRRRYLPAETQEYPETPPGVEWSGTQGAVSFARGPCRPGRGR